MSNADLDAKVIALDRARESAEPRPPEFADDALALLFAERHKEFAAVRRRIGALADV